MQNSEIKGQRYLTEQSKRAAQAARRGKEFEEHLRQIVEDHRNDTRPGDERHKPGRRIC